MEQEDVTILNLLLDAGADMGKVRDDGTTPLISAAWFGRQGHAKVLLEKGANVDVANKRGDTAIDIAANRGHDEIVMMLLESME
jgi:ankyrin repeat protein